MVVGHLDGMFVQELMLRVEALETNATRPSSFERGDSSTGSVAHMEECIEELDSS